MTVRFLQVRLLTKIFFDSCLNQGIQPYFTKASFQEFKDKDFVGYGYLTKERASHNPQPSPNNFPPILCRAPLTLVRSEKADIDAQIKVLFNQTFTPTQPTFPSPTTIKQENETSVHSWNLHVNQDQTLSTKDNSEVLHKINMVWWEALRNTAPQPVNIKDSTCIKGSDIGSFIRQILTKKGIAPEEQTAFIAYWEESFKGQENSHLQVRLVPDHEIATLLPEMKVDCDVSFELKRLYFQFIPVDQPVNDMAIEDYIKGLTEETHGKNLIIDLGAEIINKDGTAPCISEDLDFNERFAKKYIFV